MAEVFPSLLTAEGKKSPEPAPSRPVNPPVESSEAETVILTEELEEKLKLQLEEDDYMTNVEKAIKDIDEKVAAKVSASTNTPSSTTKSAGAPVPPTKKATTAKELRDLMYQHYSVGKGKLKKPSANAIKKGKVPPPTCSNPNDGCCETKKAHDESTDEMSEESDDEDNDTCCSDTSKGTTTTASESHGKNGAHCSCCYCEVFGSGGQTVAPVSRNYPEMRERLRLLLSKKKRKNQGQPPPPPPPKTRPHQPRASSASSSASSNLLSSRSESNVKHTSAPTQQTPPETEIKDEKALDELLDFIEGNQKSSNEKKKAKKERQKQKKIEEIRKKEDEDRRRKAAEEAERKRREEEANKAAEAARLLDKKKKKKEAQRLKKLAAKGIEPPPKESSPSEGSVSSLAALEELKAKHMRELQVRQRIFLK